MPDAAAEVEGSNDEVPFPLGSPLGMWKVSGKDGFYKGVLMLCWGLVQARCKQMSQRDIEPVCYYPDALHSMRYHTEHIQHKRPTTELN